MKKILLFGLVLGILLVLGFGLFLIKNNLKEIPCPLGTIYVGSSDWEEVFNRPDIYEREFCSLQNNGRWVVFKFKSEGGMENLYYLE